jgi:hypothetical protein
LADRSTSCPACSATDDSTGLAATISRYCRTHAAANRAAKNSASFSADSLPKCRACNSTYAAANGGLGVAIGSHGVARGKKSSQQKM